MKRLSLLILVVLVTTVVAMAQYTPNQTVDVLGAHGGYGRGCVMCHAPHSGSEGNGTVAAYTSKDPNNGMYALWGQDLTPLYGLTFNFAGDGNSPTAAYPVTLPTAGTLAANLHDPNGVVLLCLSCHDGVTAVVGMMKGTTVESLPIVGGNAPTLLAKAAPGGSAPLAYNNDHPVGDYAILSCGGHGWDCVSSGPTVKIAMTGTASSAFLNNYLPSFWNSTSYPLSKTSSGSTVNAVTCTTCHNQHSMTAYANSKGTWNTMFFIKGYYNPTAGSNSVAQFCRNCHGGESNEMNGVMNVLTY
jgi:hypothetical protein